MTRPALSRCRKALALLTALVTLSASAQRAPSAAPEPPSGGSAPGEIALAPSRFELPIEPGEEQTVVVNVISSGNTVGGKPLRLLASLGDWNLTASGDLQFSKPGTSPSSAAPWMIYSPVEFTVSPGQTYPIRVTISVPKDAPPGDRLAVLFVEERPADLKSRTNTKQLVFHFRLAAIFYVMVPPLTTKGTLTALKAAVTPRGLEVHPSLRNDGNTHVRPVHSFQLLDKEGKIVAEQKPVEAYPVLANAEFPQPLVVPADVPAGEYSLRYRVDFKDGSKVIEGRTTLVVPTEPAGRGAPGKR